MTFIHMGIKNITDDPMTSHLTSGRQYIILSDKNDINSGR